MNIKELVHKNYKSLIELSDSLMIVGYKGEILYYSPKTIDLFGDICLENKDILNLFEENTTLREVFEKRIYNLPVEAVIKCNGSRVIVLVTKLKKTGIDLVDRLIGISLLCVNINNRSIPSRVKAINNAFTILISMGIIVGLISMIVWGGRVIIEIQDNKVDLQNKPTK